VHVDTLAARLAERVLQEPELVVALELAALEPDATTDSTAAELRELERAAELNEVDGQAPAEGEATDPEVRA
jgi:hypothetical protein